MSVMYKGQVGGVGVESGWVAGYDLPLGHRQLSCVVSK